MKLGSLFIAATLLASSSAWAGFPSPFGTVTVNKVQNMKLKTATIQSTGKGDKTKTEKIDDKDLANILCDPDVVTKDQELVALINCPVEDDGSGSSLEDTQGFWLTVVDKDTNTQSEGCEAIFVELYDENVEFDKNGDVSQINTLMYSEFSHELGFDGEFRRDVWFEGSATISAKVQNDKVAVVGGKNCVHKVVTKSVIGAEEVAPDGPDNPITDGKLKIGSVKAGTVID